MSGRGTSVLVVMAVTVSMPCWAAADGWRGRGAGVQCAAALAGDAEAAFALGRSYLTGRGVRRNAAMGAAWIAEAARLGKRRAAALVPQVGVRLPAPVCRPGSARPAARPSPELLVLVREVAARHRLDPALVLAVMRIESGFDPKALSPKGASGLMQLMPATARRFGVGDIWDPRQNVEAGCSYLRFLLDRYDGDVRRAAAAYNAGEGAVDQYGGVPPYGETVAYVGMLAGIYPAPRHPPVPAPELAATDGEAAP